MKCTACKEPIPPQEFDIFNAFRAPSPMTFRFGHYHKYCYEVIVCTAMETPAKKEGFTNRWDEYVTHESEKVIF